MNPPLLLAERARVRVTLISGHTNECNGDLFLLAPSFENATAGQRLWSSYLDHIGESTILGPYAAGTQLEFGLAPASYCAWGNSRPSSGTNARIALRVPGVWDIWWEDHQDQDFNDLVVRVEVLPIERIARPLQ